MCQPTQREKIFMNTTFDRWSIFKIYEEDKKLDIRKLYIGEKGNYYNFRDLQQLIWIFWKLTISSWISSKNICLRRPDDRWVFIQLWLLSIWVGAWNAHPVSFTHNFRMHFWTDILRIWKNSSTLVTWIVVWLKSKL